MLISIGIGIKGYFSLNISVVVGPSLEILNVIVRLPGSSQDKHINENLIVFYKIEENQMRDNILSSSD